MSASSASMSAVRWFKVVWATSWVIKLAVLLTFLFLVLALTGGHG